MRWDSASGQYDMGFRNYAPGLNQFLTRDMYNGALADMQLTTDPFTGNRYTFAAGNPITNIELDGHVPTMVGGGGSCPARGCPVYNGGGAEFPICNYCQGSDGGGNRQPGLPRRSICQTNPYACGSLASQLNEGSDPRRGNNWIWNKFPANLCAGPGLGVLIICGSMAPAAEGNDQQGNGNTRASRSGPGDWLADLIARAVASAGNGTDTSGTIAARLVRFSQDSISQVFKGEKGSVLQLAEKLGRGEIPPKRCLLLDYSEMVRNCTPWITDVYSPGKWPMLNCHIEWLLKVRSAQSWGLNPLNSQPRMKEWASLCEVLVTSHGSDNEFWAR
jgi:RHS repeat-associated protein